MKLYLFLLLPLLLVSQFSNSYTKDKEIAITFDDAPRSAVGYFSGPERATKLIDELATHNIGSVVFFANSKSLNTEGAQRLKTYSQAGHVLANHTHSHPDFNKTTLKAYTENVLSADEKLSQFEGFKKLFRFPYLRDGDTREKRDGMKRVLKTHGYINAYITLNNYDWYIESLFQQAIKQGVSINFERLKRFYVQVMIESIEYYDQMAQTHLGRSPKHILLLHETDISALFIGDLVEALRQKNWKIISTQEAYTDEIASYEPKHIFPYNPGRIGEIARDNGQKKGLWHSTLDEKYLKNQFNSEVLFIDKNRVNEECHEDCTH